MHVQVGRACLFLICALLFTQLLVAQEYRGRVQGLVADPSGAAVSGATVTLQNDKTGVTDTRTTGADGQYLFDLVQPGSYTVTVEMQGFSKSIHPNIVVQERADITVNSRLQIGTVASSVVVTATAPDIDFNSANLHAANHCFDRMLIRRC
jgi:hypothetical protein